LLRELLNYGERIAVYGGSIVRVVFVDEGESTVRADAIGEIGVAAGD